MEPNDNFLMKRSQVHVSN